MPSIDLPSEVVLDALLPPILYAAAISIPTVDFRRNLGTITSLSVVLVVVTAFSVVFLPYNLLPDLNFAAAVALGAIISPPDAVAATSVGRRLDLPPPILMVLEGENLVSTTQRHLYSSDRRWRLLQGGTLPALIRLLGIRGVDQAKDHEQLATLLDEMSFDGLTVLDDPAGALERAEDIDPDFVERVRQSSFSRSNRCGNAPMTWAVALKKRHTRFVANYGWRLSMLNV